jgi:mannose-6-phosphate isomerase-like protein (cupin superfamily)
MEANDHIDSAHPAAAAHPAQPAPPAPRRIEIDPNGGGYTRILGGPPESVTMRSGQVILAPGKSVGRHSTQGYEELIVVLAGAGQLYIMDAGDSPGTGPSAGPAAGNAPGGRVIELGVNVVAYCPPRTEHDVVNTGTDPLRYLFIVAHTADESPAQPAGGSAGKGAPN